MNQVGRAFLSLLVLGCSVAAAQDANPGQVVPGRYIVMLRGSALPATVAARHGAHARHEYSKAIHGFAADLPPQALDTLLRDADVEMVIQDRKVDAIGKPTTKEPASTKPSKGKTPTPTTPPATNTPPDTTTPPPTGGDPAVSTQVIPAGVQHIGATGLAYTGSGIGVAVVDTGLDMTNADLTVNASSFYSYTTSPQDDNGHGTHVAGTIAARDNMVGVVGVAPQATLYAVKVLDGNGSGTDSSVLAGLDWIARNAASVNPAICVVNMSLGRPGTLSDDPAYRLAVQNLTHAGITVVVAAGNDAASEVTQMVPATYPEVIAVGSTTAKLGASTYPGFAGIDADTASYFTTDGALQPAADGTGFVGVTISAPGEDEEDVDAYGTITSVGILSLKVGGGTTQMSGTSMAAPHVAGVVALLQQKYGGALAPEDVRNMVMLGASNPAAPYASPTSTYTFDGDLEGILSASGALSLP